MWRRVTFDSAVLFASALALAGLQAAFRIVAMHGLSVGTYGRVALLVSLFNLLLVVGHFGIPTATARIAACTATAAEDARLVGAALRAVWLPCAVASFLVGVAAHLLLGSSLATLVAALGMPPMVLSALAGGYLRGKGSIWKAAAVQPVNACAQLGALVAIVTTTALTPAWLIAAFSLGNAAAALAGFALVASLRHPATASDRLAEPGLQPLPAFGFWLTAATLAFYALSTLPRLGLAHTSYAAVAFLDLALLAYSLPQRLTASLVTAIVPLAARGNLDPDTRTTVPGKSDAVLLLLAVGALDLVLWQTHAVGETLDLLGLSRYSAAEPLVLVLLLATPADLLFAVHSGLLQGFGHSRRLAGVAWYTLLVCGAAIPLAARFGPTAVAALIAAGYWLLYAASRHAMRPSDVEERPILIAWVRRAEARSARV